MSAIRWRTLNEVAEIMYFSKEHIKFVWLGCLLLSWLRPSAPNNVLYCENIVLESSGNGTLEKERAGVHFLGGLDFSLFHWQWWQGYFHVSALHVICKSSEGPLEIPDFPRQTWVSAGSLKKEEAASGSTTASSFSGNLREGQRYFPLFIQA